MTSNSKKRIPQYLAIYQHIAEAIHAGTYAPGDRLPTEENLGKMFDVGRQTVLKALDQLKADGLIVRHQGSGSFVADASAARPERSLGKSTKSIGIVCSSLADGFAHQVVVGVEQVLRKSGYEAILCNSEYDTATEAAHLRRLHNRGVDGILLVPYRPPANRELIETIRNDAKRPTQVVCVDRGYPESDLPIVKIDNRSAAREAVEYLIQLGHRRIGFIVNTLAMMDSVETIRERYEGYREALAAANIRFDKELVQEIGSALAARRPMDVGLEHFAYQPMHKLLMQNPRPTAVFLLWDELAPGALAAIRNSGLECPGDVSLVGFNDDLLARLMPVPLTTMRQPAEQIGREAADMILQLIAGNPGVVRQRVLAASLVVRQSTARSDGQSPLDTVKPAAKG